MIKVFRFHKTLILSTKYKIQNWAVGPTARSFVILRSIGNSCQNKNKIIFSYTENEIEKKGEL